MRCAVASAADSVIVMTKSVAANPSRHKTTALPFQRGKQLLENRDAALAVRAHPRDPAVHRQRAEQRQQHQDERGDGREEAGGEKRDAGLVGEGREVVDARQAHDAPPRGRVSRLGVRADGFVVTLEKPDFEAVLEGRRQRVCSVQ